tara:strand:- start:17 stop:493 length:477 start_codon:yes stop_codon:yes gene_type:complete
LEVDASRREVIDIFTSENFIEMSLIFSCTCAEIGQTGFGGHAMSTFLPQDVQAGLDAARIKALRKSSRLKIKTDLESFRVLRLWDNGFSLEAGTAPGLRGLVDIYDGERHLYECLIIASDEENGEMRFEFKRNTVVTDQAPVDFYRSENAPVALLEVR